MSPLGWLAPGPASSLSRTWQFDISILWPHRSQNPSSHYFPGHWDLTPNKKKIKGGRSVPSLGAEECCPSRQGRHSSWKSFVPGTNQETEMEMPRLGCCSPFYSVRDPSLSGSAANSQGRTSLLSSASLDGARESMDISLAFLSASYGFHSQHCVHWMM